MSVDLNPPGWMFVSGGETDGIPVFVAAIEYDVRLRISRTKTQLTIHRVGCISVKCTKGKILPGCHMDIMKYGSHRSGFL